ncbi:uncharacterized protein LOC8070455 [Sorghum bicolor]|uniref:uncharacterized protein LOC8070455 n=1 Tax=Sorghum bicolor TaxID=4558 RepID=UPI000B4241BE|nr:uncharacterized protein LOC8070455 [Sorghum bicolor]|eukprot:XP_021311424.1 uncharacterized protein LOC8070455 [Sorghum bicolor]
MEATKGAPGGGGSVEGSATGARTPGGDASEEDVGVVGDGQTKVADGGQGGVGGTAPGSRREGSTKPPASEIADGPARAGGGGGDLAGTGGEQGGGVRAGGRRSSGEGGVPDESSEHAIVDPQETQPSGAKKRGSCHPSAAPLQTNKANNWKRTCIRGRQPAATASSDDEEDVFMTPRHVVETPRRQTRASTVAKTKQAMAKSSGIHPKQRVTFKEPAEVKNKKRKATDVEDDGASAKPARTSTCAPKHACTSEDKTKAPRWNVRSYPKRIHNLLNGLSTEQKKIFLEDTGFDKLLQFKLERNIPPAFLQWLYKRIDHHTMTIRLGPGKELKLTKEVFYRILGLPKTGAQQEKIEEWSLRKDEAKDLRKALKITELKEFNPDILIQHVKKKGTDELTKRCFFIVLFNCMLFCTGSWVISNNEIMRTADMSNFHKIDWCHEIYTFFVHQMELFANDLKKPQVSYTIPGCSVAVALYYFDWLDHKDGAKDRRTTSRIGAYVSDTIDNLLSRDVIRDKQTIIGYGKLDFIPVSQTCYIGTPEVGGISIPRISTLLGDKLMSLAEGDHDHILGYINEYDDEVQHQCHNIEAAIDRIVEKQREMTDVFGSMIDNFIANQNEQVFHTGQQNIAAGPNVVTGQTSTHGEGSKTDGTNAGLGDRTTHPEEDRVQDQGKSTEKPFSKPGLQETDHDQGDHSDRNQAPTKPVGQPSTEYTSQETDCRDIDRETIDGQGTHEQCDHSDSNEGQTILIAQGSREATTRETIHCEEGRESGHTQAQITAPNPKTTSHTTLRTPPEQTSCARTKAYFPHILADEHDGNSCVERNVQAGDEHEVDISGDQADDEVAINAAGTKSESSEDPAWAAGDDEGEEWLEVTQTSPGTRRDELDMSQTIASPHVIRLSTNETDATSNEVEDGNAKISETEQAQKGEDCNEIGSQDVQEQPQSRKNEDNTSLK